jgi:hypothetical protein
MNDETFARRAQQAPSQLEELLPLLANAAPGMADNETLEQLEQKLGDLAHLEIGSQKRKLAELRARRVDTACLPDNGRSLQLLIARLARLITLREQRQEQQQQQQLAPKPSQHVVEPANRSKAWLHQVSSCIEAT